MNFQSALKTSFLYVLSLIAYTALGQGQEDIPVYSLEQCIEFALANNQDIKNASLEEALAKAQVGQTISEGLPQITGSAEISNNVIIPVSFLPAFFFDSSIPPDDGRFVPVEFSQKYAGAAGVSLNQLIFDGSYFVGLQAAKTYKELSAKAHIKTKIDVVEAVTKAYYTALINKERTTLLDQNFARLDSLLRETTVMFDNGFAEKIDVDRIKVQFNNLKVERSKIERLLETSYLLLKYQMGMDVYTPIALADQIADITLEVSPQDEGEFDYSDRIEYSQMETNRKLAALDLKNNKVQYLPKISAFAGIGANMSTNFSDEIFDFKDRWFENAAIGARLTLPIFDGLLKSYKIQSNRVQIQQIENQFVRIKNSIELEKSTAKINLMNSLETLEAQEETLELAAEVFRITKIKYQEGVGSNLEVLDAETSFKEAETNYYGALYDALISKVELDKALGILYR